MKSDRVDNIIYMDTGGFVNDEVDKKDINAVLGGLIENGKNNERQILELVSVVREIQKSNIEMSAQIQSLDLPDLQKRLVNVEQRSSKAIDLVLQLQETRSKRIKSLSMTIKIVLTTLIAASAIGSFLLGWFSK